MPATKRKSTAKKSTNVSAAEVRLARAEIKGFDRGLQRGYQFCEAGEPRSSVGLRNRR